MNQKRFVQIFMCCFFLLLLFALPAFANKSAVTIEAPAETSPGSTITIKLNITHKGNSGFHYTQWVSLNINGTEVKRWEYTRKERPESDNFSLFFTQTVDSPIEIVAQARCNIHGSKGPATFKVDVK